MHISPPLTKKTTTTTTTTTTILANQNHNINYYNSNTQKIENRLSPRSSSLTLCGGGASATPNPPFTSLPLSILSLAFLFILNVAHLVFLSSCPTFRTKSKPDIESPKITTTPTTRTKQPTKPRTPPKKPQKWQTGN